MRSNGVDSPYLFVNRRFSTTVIYGTHERVKLARHLQGYANGNSWLWYVCQWGVGIGRHVIWSAGKGMYVIWSAEVSSMSFEARAWTKMMPWHIAMHMDTVLLLCYFSKSLQNHVSWCFNSAAKTNFYWWCQLEASTCRNCFMTVLDMNRKGLTTCH